MSVPEKVDVYFDYACPFADSAARWVNELKKKIGDEVQFEFKFFPLEQVNAPADVEEAIWDLPRENRSPARHSMHAGAAALQQGREAFEGRAVTDAGGNRDHRHADQSADHAGESAFHASADDDDPRLGQRGAMSKQAVNAGNADVVQVLNFVAHHFGGGYRLFCDGDVAGAGGDYGDDSLAIAFAIPFQGDGSGEGAILHRLHFRGHGFKLFDSGPRGQHVPAVLCQPAEDAGDLGGGLTLAENDFGHALAQGAVVIDFGETEVFKR